jgi:hypothetical protein
MSNFLAIRTAAKAVGTNHETLRKAIRNGELRAYRADPFSSRPNPRLRVKLDEVRLWQEKQVYRPSQSPAQCSNASPITPRAPRSKRPGGQHDCI